VSPVDVRNVQSGSSLPFRCAVLVSSRFCVGSTRARLITESVNSHLVIFVRFCTTYAEDVLEMIFADVLSSISLQ
jgi:hypothetical protein